MFLLCLDAWTLGYLDTALLLSPCSLWLGGGFWMTSMFDYGLYFLLFLKDIFGALTLARRRGYSMREKVDKVNPDISLREKKLKEIRKKLNQQREDLISGAGIALNELPDETIFPELGDQASAEIDRNFMLKLKGRERKLLKKIDEAIEKIDNGTYGICENCGEEINIKRLEARPVTTMCIECKTEQEEEEKLRER